MIGFWEDPHRALEMLLAELGSDESLIYTEKTVWTMGEKIVFFYVSKVVTLICVNLYCYKTGKGNIFLAQQLRPTF